MKDQALLPAMERMTAADNAVSYFLHVMQRNPDLRYHSLGTEFFERFCSAEAKRTGLSVEAVRKLRSVDLQPKHRRRAPRLARALKHLESLSHAARLMLDRFGPVELAAAGEGLRELREALEAIESEGGLS